MKFKTVFVTLLIGLGLFFLLVSIGIKYDWGKFFFDAGNEQSANQSYRLPDQPDAKQQQQQGSAEKAKAGTGKFELVEEQVLSNDMEEQIRNDCIRASRRAGVGDDRIFAVVEQCVELSRQSAPETISGGEPATPEAAPVPESMQAESLEEDNDELTRRACEMIADEDPNLAGDAREEMIQACINENR